MSVIGHNRPLPNAPPPRRGIEPSAPWPTTVAEQRARERQPKPDIFRTWTGALWFFALLTIGTTATLAAVYAVASWAVGVVP